ncbi:MAG TPA: DUF3301 domain-containing protein [Rhodanobacteraceae bacterium]
MPVELLVLLALAIAACVWLDAMRQHDHALRAAKRICAAQEVQLLDHTVGLSALRLRRHEGRLMLERHYGFEVSLTGNDRHRGHLWLLQGQLAGVSAPWLKPPDVRAMDARAEVADLLDRISHDHTPH